MVSSGPRGGGGPAPTMAIRSGGPGSMVGRRIEKARDPRGTLKRLASYLQPFLPAIVLVLVLELVHTGLNLVGPILLGRAVDQFTQLDRAGLARSVLLMVGVYAVAWLAQYLMSYTMAGVSQGTLRILRRDLFDHLQALAVRFFDTRPHGELMSRLTNDIDAINRVLTGTLTQLLSGVLTMFGVMVIMLRLNVWLALAAMSLTPLMMWLTFGVAKRTRVGFRELQTNLGAMNGQMEETVSGGRVVQAFGQQGAVIAEFEQHNQAVRVAGTRAMTLSLILMPLITVLTNANIAVVAGVGAYLAIGGAVSVGLVATFFAYSRRYTQPLRSMSDLYNTIQSALAGAERVFEVLDEPADMPDKANAAALEQIEGDVVFDGVSFGYDPNVTVLKEVSLHARPGETVALVGPTGAGKTTIVNLLMRFYDVNAGAIRIDGLDIRDVRKDSLRRQLGIVLQDTFLFSDSVLENIRYGRLDATDEECIQAAVLANADQFIRRLPDGYQTELSERAVNLSQGQRQLLSITRAVLADPRILVLDEATSSVDTRTEVRIQQALLRLMEGRTAFVIAHRLSTIRKADQVLVIDYGEIIERGTHESLLAERGFYHHLYMSQFRGQVQPEPEPVGGEG